MPLAVMKGKRQQMASFSLWKVSKRQDRKECSEQHFTYHRHKPLDREEIIVLSQIDNREHGTSKIL